MHAGRTPRPATAAFLLIAVLAVASHAEVPTVLFPSESRPTAARLADARKLIDDKKWAEAIDELQAILDAAGNDLVALTPRYCVPARRQCHLLLAQLPPDALKAYRARREPQARKWLDQGRADRDGRLLRKVVDEAFCTRAGEAALDALGDQAFERGRFEEAEGWWRLLAAPPDANPDAIDSKNDLLYPDPQGGTARVQAKQVLARVFRDPHADRTALLKAFRERNPDAAGTLAGRKGKFADLLEEIARQARGDPVGGSVWSTYGGDGARGLVLPAPPRFFDDLERLCRRGPEWRFDLEPRAKGEGEATPLPPVTPTGLARSLAFHPLIVGDQAVIADARCVTAFDLRTGASAVWADVDQLLPAALPDLKLPLAADLLDLRYTLTAGDDCLYVRLGAQKIGHVDDVDKNDPALLAKEAARERTLASVLACVDARPDVKGNRVRWFVRPVVRPGRPENAQNGAIFEGAPLLHEGRLYLAATYFENDRTVTAVVCYLAGTDGKPVPRWTQVVCETQELRGREKRTRHHLLTAAGPHVVYCSHSGAVVALDAQTGKPAWALRYPGRDAHENPLQPVLRDLTPPVYADGRLFVAVADYDHLLCLDPLTGRTLWDRESLEPTHLLGVGQGRLIFTTIHGLRAVGAADGGDADGWQLPDGGGERAPAGRGLLVGAQVLWPTANGIVVCGQRDGVLDYRPTLGARVPCGNLVYANGCLAVADRTTLSVFVPDGMVLEKRKDQTRLTPAAPRVWLDYARAQADVGSIDNARESLKKAGGLLAPPERRLRDDLQRATLDLLFSEARRAADRTDWTAADKAIKEATTAEQPARARLETLVRAADWWEDVGQPARAVAVWESLLTAPDLRGRPAFAFGRRQLTASNLAAERLNRLPKKPGAVASLPTQPAAGEVPNLPLPLARQWHIKLAADERLLPTADGEDLFVTARPGQLTARTVETGKPRWQHRLAFTPEWAARHLDTVLTAGPQGAACLRQDSGEVVWEIAAPALFAGQSPETLSSFQIANGRFFFLSGRQWLFALDAATGDVLWHRAAPGAGLGLPAPSGRFNPAFVAQGNAVLVQATLNRSLLLDAATGRTLRTRTVAAGVWWPIPLDQDGQTLCFAPTDRTIVQIDTTTGATPWEHSLTEATTLTGAPPQLVGRKNTLLALIPTNLGDQLMRLDPATGKALWTQPPLLAGLARPVEPSGWALDDDAAYFEQGGRLCARSLADGKPLWDQPLAGPLVPYHTRRLRDYVLTYPATTGSSRMQFRFLGGSVQWDRVPGRDLGFPLVCSDPKTGQVIERINLAPPPPRVEFRWWPARFTMQPQIDVGPVESHGEKSVVLVAAHGLLVAVGDRMWRLKPAEK